MTHQSLLEAIYTSAGDLDLHSALVGAQHDHKQEMQSPWQFARYFVPLERELERECGGGGGVGVGEGARGSVF